MLIFQSSVSASKSAEIQVGKKIKICFKHITYSNFINGHSEYDHQYKVKA